VPAAPDSDPDPDPDPIEQEAVPKKTELTCFNNVFNPSKGNEAIIRVELDKQAHVRVTIYDNRGREIIKVLDEEKEAGFYPIPWDGTDDDGRRVGSGIYIVCMEAGSYTETKKIAVVK